MKGFSNCHHLAILKFSTHFKNKLLPLHPSQHSPKFPTPLVFSTMHNFIASSLLLLCISSGASPSSFCPSFQLKTFSCPPHHRFNVTLTVFPVLHRRSRRALGYPTNPLPTRSILWSRPRMHHRHLRPMSDVPRLRSQTGQGEMRSP